MIDTHSNTHEVYPDPHHDVYSKTIFGFWIYLLTDFVLFGILFATYAVLQDSTFQGPSAKDLFNPSYNLVQTLILLTSSLTVAFGGAFAHRRKKGMTIVFFVLTFILGLIFADMQYHEFSHVIQLGYSWKTSAFLSAYFTLVFTHTIHILVGLLWIIVLIIPVCVYKVTNESVKRLTCMRMFWQFLNIVWIFIFTMIYLLGVK